METIPKIISTCGLVMNMLGAWFIAWEIVNQYKGQKTQVKGGSVRKSNLGHTTVDEQPLVISKQKTEDTPAYKQWEFKKYFKMEVGILMLTLGFILQIISLWFV